MVERNLTFRAGLKDGELVSAGLKKIGESGQTALEKVVKASEASTGRLLETDRAITLAEKAFDRTSKAAQIYEQASQRLSEQQKQGKITAEQYQGVMAELDKRHRQAAAAVKLETAANNEARNRRLASNIAVEQAASAYRNLQQNTENYRKAIKILEQDYRTGLYTAQEYKGVLSQLNKTFEQGERSAFTYRQALQWGGAILGITSVTYAIQSLKDQSLKAGSEMQSLNARLVAITGDSTSAAEAMNFLQGMSQRQSVDLLTLTDAYGRLLPAVKSGALSMGDMRNMLSLVNDNMRAFGLSTSSQQALLYGLGQVLGSANVTMEDLRQVTDQMPGSFAAVEKAMGLASGELKDLVATGALTAKDIIPAMTAAFEANAGAAEKMGDTYAAASTRMDNSSRAFFAQLGSDLGIIQAATGLMKALTSAMDDYTDSVGNMNKKQLGEGLKESIDALQLQQGKVDQLNKKIREAQKRGDTVEANLLMSQLEMENKALDRRNEIYGRYTQALTPVTAATKAQAQATNDNAKADSELIKTANEVIKKYGAVGDNYGKSSQKLALETLQKYKATDAYKKLAESTDKVSVAKVKETLATEEQLKKAIALESQKKEETAAKKDNKNAIEEYIAKLREETKESAESGKQAEISKALWEAQNIAKREHITLTNENIAVITAETAKRYDNSEAAKKQKQAEHDLAEAVQKAAEKRQEEAKKAQEEFEEPFKRAGENIQNYSATMFADIAKNGKLNMQDAADYGKNAFFQMIGEVTAAMIFKPVIQPVIAQAMGAVSSGSSGGGTGGLGGLSSLGSLAGASGGINSFGTKFGFSSGLEAARPAAGFVGPMPQAQGSLFGTTTLMGALSGAGMGLSIGSMNLFGGNQMGSTIGGTVGGLAGSFFGPLGSLAGSAIGSGIGGLFGPGAKVSAAEFAGNIGANDNLGGLSYGAKNGQIAQARGLSDALGASLAGLVANGIDIANENIRGAINSKSGNRFEALGKTFGFDPQDAESVSLAVAKLSVELAKAGNNTGSLGIALQHIQTDGRKAEEILSDLNFAAMYDQLDKVQEPASQYTAQMEAMTKQYQDMIPVAERLGLATDKVTKAQENATKAFQDSFLKPIGAAILEMTDPLAAQIRAEQERYAAQLKDAQALGVATTSVERLHYLKMQELANQAGYFQQQILANDNDIRQQQASIAQELANRYRAVGDNIKKTLSDLSYGSLSTLTTKQKKEAAEAEVESLYKNAMLGNVDAQEQFADAVKSFLAFDQQLQGSGGTYAEDFTRMQDLLKQVGSNAERQVPIQERIYNTNTAQLNALQTLNNTTAGVTSAISDLSRSLLDSFFKGGNGGLFSDASLLPKGKDASYLDSMTSVGVTVREYHTFGRMVGYTGEYGAGGFDAWAKANPDKAASFNQMVVSAGGRPRQFEHGGLTPRNQFFTVGEKGKTELMFSGDSHTVYSAEQSRKLLDGAGGGSGELLQETKALRKDIQTLTRVIAASGDMNNEGLAAIESRLASIEEKARLEAAA